MKGHADRLLRLPGAGFCIYAQDLPSGSDIAGLVGLSFLRRVNYVVSRWRGILVERTAGAGADA